MNNIIIALIMSILAGLGTLIGSLLIFIPKYQNKEYTPLFLSISATIMFLFSIFDLIPSSVFNILSNNDIYKSAILILISFILGVLLILIIDHYYDNDNKIFKIGILSFFSMMIHNLPEGMATFLSSVIDYRLGISLMIAIMLHNIPEGICISMPIYQSTHDKKKTIKTCFIAAISEPLGAVIAYIFLKDVINTQVISIILLFVSGIMITLSINNIYKEILNNTKYLYKGIIIGMIISIIAILI